MAAAKRKRPRGAEQTPTFSCDFALLCDPQAIRVLSSRFEAARQLYNACLSDSLKRLDAARNDPAWQAATRLSKKITAVDALGAKKKIANPARREAFNALRSQYGLSEYATHAHPSLAADCWIRTHLDINTAQKVATRAWRAVEGYMFGRLGRPRYVPWFEPFESVEGKGSAGIRFVAGADNAGPCIEWNSKSTRHGQGFKLSLPLVVDPNDELEAHALAQRVKYVRLLRKEIRGEICFSAQLVCEGQPFVKHEPKPGRVAFDIGPSTVAVVAEDGQHYVATLADDVEAKEQGRRRYQRRLDRQRRANNPDNYNAGKTIKPKEERQPWVQSARQLATRAELRELERRQAASRKNAHGREANHILSLGSTVLAEKVSARSFQINYGPSVRFRAPGLFMNLLRRKADASESGGYCDISTYKTFLSQRCLCGQREKKSLSQRQHVCGCRFVPEGQYVQRDEFSAFLALFCTSDDLDLQAAQAAWQDWGANCLLRSLSSESRALDAGSPGNSTLSIEVERQSCLTTKGLRRRVRPRQKRTTASSVRGEPSADRQPGTETSSIPSLAEIPRPSCLGNS